VSRRTTQVVVTGAIAILLAAAGVAVAGADRGRGRDGDFDARLRGVNEVPVVITEASGRFEAEIEGDTIEYELSYSGLSAPVTAAHIHPGQRFANGGVSAFLCGGGGKPACPQEGTVEGTIVPADVIGPTSQGISAGEFDALVEAMESGLTYANVHSQMSQAGEIRGQIDD
jgi:hypothetical protein